MFASILVSVLTLINCYGLKCHTTYSWHSYLLPEMLFPTHANNNNIVVEPSRSSSCRASARRKGPPLATFLQPVTSGDGHHKKSLQCRHESVSEPSRAYPLSASATT
jgi:hypothetical protein